MVKVVIEYPSDYKGNRFFEQGQEVECSEEVAKQFEAIGIVKKGKADKEK